jgi:hypothetical protein
MGIRPQLRKALTASVPAPTGGWNARDAVSNMSPQDAVEMINFFPTPTDVSLRKGYVKRATNITGYVETLMNYAGPTGQKLFACAGSQIYDVTGTGNGTVVKTGLNSAQFQYVNISTPGGNFLVCCNGVDTPLVYDGTTWANISVTGVTSSTFINVNLFKNRLYFTQKNTMSCWYLPVSSIGGAASQLDFGSVARNGGYLQAMATWTLDAGYGVDDFAMFITNMGEIIVYQGTDPASASTWALKGVWQMGQTFNRKCFFKWGGDLLLLSQDGLVPMSTALQSSRLDPRVNLTDKIYFAVSSAATYYYDNYGWQIQYYASENMLILNIPITGGTEQYVMHTITQSWARFTNLDAKCWEVNSKKGMFFGSNGYVGEFYADTSDGGTNINASVQQAYSYFGAMGQQKRFTMVRPILLTDNGLPTVLAGINVDFETTNETGTLTFNPSSLTVATWDTSLWDQAYWGGKYNINKNWQSVTGIGYAGGLQLTTASQGIDVHWTSTDFVMETGSVI